MFRRILYWIREDDTALGRPRLAGNQDPTVESLAVPMSVLGLIHELDGLKAEDLDFNEVRAWAVKKIRLHVQRRVGDSSSRVLENVTAGGKEIPGSEGRKLVPGK